MRLPRLLVVLAAVTAVGAQTLTDDFAGYPAASDASPAWEAQAVGWAVDDGALTGDSGTILWKAAPYAAALTFGCDVTPQRELKGDWLTAGIGFAADEKSYWALQLVAAPETQQRRHYWEFCESYDGSWLAQDAADTRLERLPAAGGEVAWQLGHTYRFEVTLTAEQITARVLDGAQQVYATGFRFGATTPAVRAGRPILRAGSIATRFDNATVTVTQTAPEPVVEAIRIPPWQSRPGKAVAPGTGFFRVVERDGRWWVLDPEGKPFYIVGTDHINYNAHWCEKLGYAPYHRFVAEQYGSEAKWAETTLERLKAWNFNTLPAGHSPILRHRGLAHILFASFGSTFARREYICEPIHWTGYPDVFSPRWEAHCRLVARSLMKTAKGDPWLIGTFLDNELEWYGKKGFLVDEIFQRPADQPAKRALYDWLVQRYGDHAGVNRELGTTYADRQAFLDSLTVPPATPTLSQVRDEFLAVIAERYFSVPAQALRAVDPDHLVLGCRFAGRTPAPVLAAAGRWNDIFTINTYPRVDFQSEWAPGVGGQVFGVPRQLTDDFAVVKRPMILTEWSFPALDSGLPCQHGAGMRVDTQEQKAACYRIFANAMADLPFMVGYHYFMWVDEPELGISSTFPEDSNYGLVNVRDEPWELLTKMATEVNAKAAARHARSLASGDLEMVAVADGVEVRNLSKQYARGQIWIGQAAVHGTGELTLPPGGKQRVPAPPGGPWVAELQRWDGTKVRLSGGPRLRAGEVGNQSAQPLTDVPVVLANPPAMALLPRLAAGQTVAVPPAGPLQPAERLDLRGEDVTWTCARADGSLFDAVNAGGLPLGNLVFAAHEQVDGHDQWVSTDTVERLSVAETAAGWLVEAVVSRRGSGPAITAVNDAGQQAAVPTGPATFRARVQAAVFRKGGLCLVRPLTVENTDRRPWRLVDAFWFCRPAIGGAAADDQVGGPGVPNYYLAAQFWTDRQLGGAFGAAGSAPWQVMFWADEGGGLHPDARLPVNVDLAAGARWTNAEATPLWVFARREAGAWREIAARSRLVAANVAVGAAGKQP